MPMILDVYGIGQGRTEMMGDSHVPQERFVHGMISSTMNRHPRFRFLHWDCYWELVCLGTNHLRLSNPDMSVEDRSLVPIVFQIR